MTAQPSPTSAPTPIPASTPTRAQRAAIAAIRAYQGATAYRPSPCRYIPSCSEYAREAVEAHGAVRGTGLAIRRVSRCHPFGGFGFDPVPPPRPSRRTAR